MKKRIQAEYTPEEKRLFRRLNSPKKIQDYLNTLRFNFEEKGETCMSPRRVIREQTAHCMEGALFAMAVMEFHNISSHLLDLRANEYDDDHVIVVFRQFGCFGALGKTNHSVLRYREPIYKTLRELVFSYFHEYFLHTGKKTLREYSDLVDMKRFEKLQWRTSQKDMFEIPNYLDKIRHHPILTSAQIRNLRLADEIEREAGKLVEWVKK